MRAIGPCHAAQYIAHGGGQGVGIQIVFFVHNTQAAITKLHIMQQSQGCCRQVACPLRDDMAHALRVVKVVNQQAVAQDKACLNTAGLRAGNGFYQLRHADSI